MGAATQNSTYNSNYFVNALPFRAYQMIYNEYFRDENLTPKVEFSIGSGTVPVEEKARHLLLRDRAWEKDYFTSALPFTQKGGDVTIPLTGDAPVYLKDEFPPAANQIAVNDQGDPRVSAYGLGVEGNTGNLQDTGANAPAWIDPQGTMEADLSQVSAATIEELRRASRLQEWLERNARGGTRYIEQIMAHFGVKSSDARLQRPEYLGGGKTPVVISEVLQTSGTIESVDPTPQANMAGHGISVGKNHEFKRFFEEHGQVIGIMSVLPKTTYQQGTRKHLNKQDRYDFYWPEFAHLGEQPIEIRELFYDFEESSQDAQKATFGYQSRYAEYKYIPSTVHGDFKQGLEFWHLGRIFDNKPALNDEFVRSDPDDRIFAEEAPQYQDLYVQVYNNIRAKRPIPRYNNPRL